MWANKKLDFFARKCSIALKKAGISSLQLLFQEVNFAASFEVSVMLKNEAKQ